MIAGAAAAALAAAGCADGSDFANDAPPPTPINVAAVIGEDELTISPPAFGAGPIVLVVANQTQDAHELVVRGPGLDQSTGQINPRGTATLKVDVGTGVYRASVDDADIEAVRFEVGAPRPSAQNELLRP